MAESEHQCQAFSITDGVLVCSGCGKPSDSTKWKANIYGKAVAAAEVENKGFISPPESKRQSKGLGR